MSANLPPALAALRERHVKCSVSSCTELEAIVATLRAVAEALSDGISASGPTPSKEAPMPSKKNPPVALKPCPFCGEQPTTHFSTALYSIACHRHSPVVMVFAYTRQAALDRWNRRAP